MIGYCPFSLVQKREKVALFDWLFPRGYVLRSSFSSLHPIRCEVRIRERKMEKRKRKNQESKASKNENQTRVNETKSKKDIMIR